MMFPPWGRSALAESQDVGSDFVRLGRRAAGVFHVHVRALNENGKGLRGGAGAIGDDREGRGIGPAALAAGHDDMAPGTILLRELLSGGGLGERGREDSVWRD